MRQMWAWAQSSPSDAELMEMPNDVRAAYLDTPGVRARWLFEDLRDAIDGLPPRAKEFLSSLAHDR